MIAGQVGFCASLQLLIPVKLIRFQGMDIDFVQPFLHCHHVDMRSRMLQMPGVSRRSSVELGIGHDADFAICCNRIRTYEQLV